MRVAIYSHQFSESISFKEISHMTSDLEDQFLFKKYHEECENEELSFLISTSCVIYLHFYKH